MEKTNFENLGGTLEQRLKRANKLKAGIDLSSNASNIVYAIKFPFDDYSSMDIGYVKVPREIDYRIGFGPTDLYSTGRIVRAWLKGTSKVVDFHEEDKMNNAERVKSFGYKFEDIDADVDPKRSNGKESTYVVYARKAQTAKVPIGDITVPYGTGHYNVKGEWLLLDTQFAAKEVERNKEVIPTPVEWRLINILVMNDKNDKDPLNISDALKEDLSSYFETNGVRINYIHTLSKVIADHDWSKDFSEWGYKYDYFVFVNNWGGEDNYAKVNRSDVADELYMINHPWKYSWNKAGTHHWIKALDHTYDAKVKIDALEKEVKDLKRLKGLARFLDGNE